MEAAGQTTTVTTVITRENAESEAKNHPKIRRGVVVNTVSQTAIAAVTQVTPLILMMMMATIRTLVATLVTAEITTSR